MGAYDLFIKAARNPQKIPPYIYQRARIRWKVLFNRIPPGWVLSNKNFRQNLLLEPIPGIDQPVLDGTGIDDFKVDWVADPFIQYHNGDYYLFAEAAKENYPNNGASIVWYKSSNGITWEYQNTVLGIQSDSDMIDSYPQLLKYNNNWYLIPSFAGGEDPINELQIYEFTDFPNTVSLRDTAIYGQVRGDPTLFEWDNSWYCIFEDFNYQLRLYYSKTLLNSDWTEHPSSPIETDRRLRPGGKPIISRNKIEFFTQGPRSDRKCLLHFQIIGLSHVDFEWKEVVTSPILYPASHGGTWNEANMHHISYEWRGQGDPVIAVDGQDRYGNYSIGLYQITPESNYQFRADQSGNR